MQSPTLRSLHNAVLFDSFVPANQQPVENLVIIDFHRQI